MLIISEKDFRERLISTLSDSYFSQFDSVTGPGRSGAVASVYASHLLGIPFLPFNAEAPNLKRLLIIDTAQQTGKTLRKAGSRYQKFDPHLLALYHEPPRVIFWYEELMERGQNEKTSAVP